MKLFVVALIAVGCMVAFSDAVPVDPRAGAIVAGVADTVNPALLQANAASAGSDGALSDIAASVQNVGLGAQQVGGWGAGTALGLGQAAAQGAGGAVNGAVSGLSEGTRSGNIFGGILKGITGAIKGGTSVNGAPSGFLSGLGGTLNGGK